MNKTIIVCIISIYLYHFSKGAITDCLVNSGKNGKECGKKSTFINVREWNFIVEDDLAYKCCYYKGYLGIEEYEGCFAFYEEDIINYKVNDLLDKMEKGTWEYSIGIKNYNASIDCSCEIVLIKYYTKIIFILIGIAVLIFEFN